MKHSKAIIFVSIVLLIGLFFLFDAHQYLTLANFKAQQDQIEQFYAHNPTKTMLFFSLGYIFITGLSLPGAALLTLVAGAIFGLLWGTVIVSFASTLGATLAFLFSRFLFKSSVENKFSTSVKTINDGIEKDGAFYLFTLRLIPIFPFFIINLVMGLTSIRTITFYLVSQVGMLAGTIVYVNAGTQISKIESISGIVSPGVLFSFALLGIFPLFAKKLIAALNARKVYKPFIKPKQFDRNLVVIGAGSGGLVSAYIAAAVKAKVTLIEKHKMGGDCLNTGCVPSKAIIRSAKFMSHIQRAEEFGFKSAQADFDFADVMERVQKVIRKVEPHDSVERYTELGVEVIQGTATITSPFTVEVGGQTLSTRNIIIASGARPFVPPIPGIDTVDYLTSDTVWELRELPKRLVVLGGGPIGSELSQSFARLGSQVSVVERSPRLLAREDEDVSKVITDKFIHEGISVLTGHAARKFENNNGVKTLICERLSDNEEIRVDFDAVLVAVGRAANISGFGAEKLGIKLTERKTIEVNEYLQTNFPNIYACGDVAGPYQFTHTAAHQAWYSAVNSLFGRFKVDYSVIPWSTFVEPEVARVGLNEQDAKAANIAYEVTTYGIDDLDRAIADGEDHGFVKVLTPRGKDKILGVTIVGEHAGDLLAEFVLAMKHGLGLNKILSTIHIYPTLAEANKYVAGNWKKAHAPEKLLAWVQRFHHWMRN